MPIERIKPDAFPTADRIEALRELFPEAFADGAVDWATLRELASSFPSEDEEETAEHFGLFWPGKREARRLAGKPAEGTLIPCPGEGVDEDKTSNIFIEGENLEVLKLLRKSYKGMIKMIYIDPPYNTGNDFVYDDNFTEPLEDYLRRTGQIDGEGRPLTTNKKSDGRFHSKWLSMMYPRLRLARELLREDGVIFLHIDEHEYQRVEIMLQELFGEENNLGTIVWDKRNPKGDARGVSQQHEFICCYCRNLDVLLKTDGIRRIKENAKKILDMAKKIINGNKTISEEMQKKFIEWIQRLDCSEGERAYCLLDQNGEVYRPVSMAWPNKKKAPDDYFKPLIHPITKKPCPVPERGWRNPPTTMEELLKNNRIIFGTDETTQPTRKYLLKENLEENVPSLLYFAGSDDQLLAELKIPFDNPKPLYVAKKLLSYVCKKNDTILDFFSGSSTTAHAVLDLNKEDGGHRKFILVQMPEATPADSEAAKAGYTTIAEIGKERIRRVIKKMKAEKAQELSAEDEAPDLGFKVLKLARSNFKPWKDYHGDDIAAVESLFENAVTPLASGWKDHPDALFTEILLLEGYPLDSAVKARAEFGANTIREVSCPQHEKRLLVCLDETISPETVRALTLGSDEIFVCLDSAIDDSTKARLDDKGMIKTI